jgi:leucyl-tRNA synthetase
MVWFLRSTSYKDALKYGFYELQTARDWYREVTSDVGMHGELVRYWIQTAALLVAPIAPHFAEHIWMSILGNETSIQLARWPTPSKQVDATVIESIVYLRGMIKTIRDSELALLKKMGKTKGAASFDPKKPKSVRIYVATAFPEWQDQCVQAVKDAYSEGESSVDDVKLRELLTTRGLIKDKRAMPFVQAFKVSNPRS